MKRNIVGLVMVAAVVVMAMVMWGTWSDALASLSSLLIVVGGCAAACIAAFPVARLTGLHKAILNAVTSDGASPERLIDELVGCAQAARSEGLLMAATRGAEGRHPLMTRGLLLVVQGAEEETIRAALGQHAEMGVRRSTQARQVLEAIGRYAPAFGVLGTLGAMVMMLRNLDDPASIGRAAAAALAAMLYGSVIATVVTSPMSDRLASREAEEELASLIITAGLCRIRAGDGPEEVRERLMAYLPGRRAAVRDTGLRKAA